MKITDIIRGLLDQVDAEVEQATQEPVPTNIRAIGISPNSIMEPAQPEEPNLLAIIQHLAGVEVAEPELGYANQPEELVAPIGAAFPKGDDMHHSKNPADIRTNAPSMYPAYQAEKR